MINLMTFFKDHFDTDRISDANLIQFTEDHIGRLESNNPDGIYSSIIDSTNEGHKNFKNAVSGKDTNYSVQQGKTMEMNGELNNFIVEVRSIEKLIAYTFRNKPGIYQEFFPQGLTEYNTANLGNIETLMDRMVNRLTVHQGDLGLGQVTLFEGLRSRFVSARKAQVEAFGTVENFDSQRTETRRVLSAQLMKNLLIIASNNVGHLEKMNDYFNQSIIRRLTDRDDGVLESNIAPGATVNIESSGITPASTFSLTNSGSTDLRYYLGASTTDTDNAGIVIHPGVNIVVTGEMLGPPGNTFLNVTNLSATTEGKYSAEIL